MFRRLFLCVALAATEDRSAGVRGAVSALGSNPVQGKAVLVKPNTRKIKGVRDSKTLSPRQRERLVDEMWPPQDATD